MTTIKELDKDFEKRPKWLQNFGKRIADTLTKGSSFQSAIKKMNSSNEVIMDMFRILQESGLGEKLVKYQSFDRGLFLAVFNLGWIAGKKRVTVTKNPFNNDETEYIKQWAVPRLEVAISWNNPDTILIKNIIKKIEKL